jgi:urease accessory protein
MRFPLVAVFSLFAIPAFAHTGTGFHLHGFEDGMMHPFTGSDHLLAMVAVGLWAAFLGGRAVWALPLAFLSAMIVGGIAGQAGLVFPALEILIAASVVALGAVLAFGLSLPVSLGAALCAAFALAHGMAHGVEMPTNAAGIAYGLGFLIATATLHMTGLCAGRFGAVTLRVLGAAMALAGFAFLAA